ncbi:excinuclease ABC subunit UvrA [Paenibacillus sp. YN15]|uniref:excinuclease ABC subunit UvrA n=1 Tax=Paenibacillus sp. YN15 TaxID=1742774 RepID=UPI000DCC5066|nr:excinuclease ABC subunit UvrA [Paenibacillus sp. YN15]RAV05630.1 ABC-ATPase UvrA [Paenibacillus sp. YN15]
MGNMIIIDAHEGNLKHVSLEIPRDRLVVLTGLSGSGKSTLAMDVLYQECQRQYLEAIGYQGIRKPNVGSIRNVSPAIRITQSESNRNPRSTVGTLTDMYTGLRMVYEKLSTRLCPHCGQPISAADCREETEKKDNVFHVYMYCHLCGHKMDKLTRTHFSYNTREGGCPTCQGLGQMLQINMKATLHEELSLEEGAVEYWNQGYKEYQTAAVYQALRHYGLPVPENVPVKDYPPLQRAVLLYGSECDAIKEAYPDAAPPKTVALGKFEGVLSTLWRRMSEKGGEAKNLNGFFHSDTCPDCKGERLGPLSRSATVNGVRLPELTVLSLEELDDWIAGLEASLSAANHRLAELYLSDIHTKIRRIVNTGLGYLSLDRQIITLSGGEMQRIKLAAALDSDLTGVIYILDEPTVGLHPKDTRGMISVLKKLRDLGNTVLVIEHDPDVMAEADFIVDIGPGSGKHGGEIIALGTLAELLDNEHSVTGRFLKEKRVLRHRVRPGSGAHIHIRHASLHNLQDVEVRFPAGCLVTVTGVSGSGKSTLVFDVLAKLWEKERVGDAAAAGLDHFDQMITIEQGAITRMKRSNVATYTDMYTDIRSLFGGLPDAKAKGLAAKHFSFNTKGGRCENCEGLGVITSNMLFFENIEVTCPVCGGARFNEEVLSVQYKGLNVNEVLHLSVEEALEVFAGHTGLETMLKLLCEVGLDYLELGQTLTTLSGGEGQRLKLANELISNKGKSVLYLMDEPTTGLHPADVGNFLKLLNRMVDAGSTIIVVEHNEQVIRDSDWIIDLGPEGGRNGGQVLFAGTPVEMMERGTTVTAECLRQSAASAH